MKDRVKFYRALDEEMNTISPRCSSGTPKTGSPIPEEVLEYISHLNTLDCELLLTPDKTFPLTRMMKFQTENLSILKGPYWYVLDFTDFQEEFSKLFKLCNNQLTKARVELLQCIVESQNILLEHGWELTESL